MKKYYCISLLMFLLVQNFFGQTNFRLIAGLSLPQNPSNADLLLNKESLIDQFYFNMNHVESQYFLGIDAQLDFHKSSFFVATKMMYTQRSCSYSCQFTVATPYHPEPLLTMRESEHLLLVPINIGCHFGAVGVYSGLNVITTLSKNSELTHMDGYESSASTMRIGWQSGVQYTMGNFAFGLEYLGNLNQVGNGMSIHQQSLALRHIPGQFIFVLEYLL